MNQKLHTIVNRFSRLLSLGSTVAVLATSQVNAQSYLFQNFDGVWSGTPAAPTGWTQTRITDVNTGPFDWVQNTYTTGWSNTGGTMPTTASPGSGASALWINDFNFGASSLVRQERRIESPTFDLTLATSPFVRFWYFNNQDNGLGANIRVVISTDDGVSWKTLSNIMNGFDSIPNSWTRIAIPIPANLRSATTKIGFSIVNRWGSHNPFIDDVSVEEFTPTTITSIATGNWNAASTWSTGTVPRAGDNVVIATGNTVTVPAVTGLIARCQNLTINASGTLAFGTTAAANMHVFGSVSVSGTLNAFNGTSGRIVFVGGDFTINTGGTANFNSGTTPIHAATTTPTLFTSGASSLVFTNAYPTSFINNGTLTNNRINNVIHLGSDTFTYNSPVSVPFVFGLWNGFVNPNGNLILGNAAASATQITGVGNGFFTSSPVFVNTNVLQRNLLYYSVNMINIDRTVRNTSFEVHDSIPISTRIVTGTLLMNTVRNVQLSFPMTVGTATTGGLTLARGIIITSNTNLLRLSNSIAPPAGVDPSTVDPNPTTHGSYIAGPVRVDFPNTNVTRTIPLGVGTNVNGLVPSSNMRCQLVLTPGANWANQSITFSIEPSPSGTTNAPLTTLSGVRAYRLNLNGGPDLPSTATLQMQGRNYTFGNSDNLLGNQDEIFIAQSTNLTGGAWTSRSNASGSGPIISNTNYPRTTTATIAPLATNGEYFAWATNAPLMVFDTAVLVRNTGALAAGASVNTVMMRLNIQTSNLTAPLSLTDLHIRTVGTLPASLAKIDTVKVWYTGSNPDFAPTTRFGTNLLSPGASATLTGSQVLTAGNNFFWVTYDINASSAIGDQYAVQIDSALIAGINRVIASPAAGVREVLPPATFDSATVTHPILSAVGAGDVNQVLARVQLSMGTGGPVNVSELVISSNGTTLLSDVTNLKVFFTGNSPVFAATNQFGLTTSPVLLSNTIAGNVLVSAGVNYFWITYDISPTATVSNFVDVELTSITVNSIIQTPIVGAPTGNRRIRGAYCATGANNTVDTDIGQLLIRALNGDTIYRTGVAIPVLSNPAATGTYTDLTNNSPALLQQGMTYSFRMDQITSGVTFYGAGFSLYIDWNDDGDFNDPQETVFQSGTLTTLANNSFTFNFTVPCFAVNSNLRMRAILVEGSPTPLACGLFSWGEAEDHTVNVGVVTPAFIQTTAIQQTGTTSAGTLNLPILRIPVEIVQNVCAPVTVTELVFNTAGTTFAGDILKAKLYKTDSSNIFNTNNLIDSVASPNGTFSFVISDTAINGINNYWVAYDVSGSAINTNVLDARFDSIQWGGTWFLPDSSSPAGNIVVSTPMTYIVSDAIHPTLTPVERPSTINPMLRVMAIMSSTGAPVQATQLSLSTNGSANPLTNADSIMVWYTGTNPNLVSPVFFGGVGAQSGTFSVNGFQNLSNDTNYFWVTYNVPGTATVGDSLDCEIATITIAGIPYAPITSAPIGSRRIRATYCASAATSVFDSDIGRIILTANNDTLMNVGQGCGANQPWATGTYTNNTAIPGINLPIGQSINLDICYASSGLLFASGAAIYIDYNDNGLWDAGEMVWASPTTFTGNAIGSFSIPCSVSPGLKRMRVVLIESVAPLTLANSCGTYSWGETEDYVVNLIPTVAAFNNTTAIQQTGTTSAGTLNLPILRIPVNITQNGCAPRVLTQFTFNTAGSTTTADISMAKLYSTGTSTTFNTSRLVDSVFSPNGTFSFMVNDTLTSGVTNYWIAYDVSGLAANNNVLDARFDSLEWGAAWYVPDSASPIGNILISTPMAYISSEAIHPTLARIERPSTNNPILRVRVIMSTTGAPVQTTQLSLNTSGSANPLVNMDSVIVWFTGASPNFTSPTFFGGVGAQSGAFSVNGSVNMLNDTNYFWVTYNVPNTAILGDSLDCEFTAITVASTMEIPVSGAPVGSRLIRSAYCVPTISSGCGIDYISQVTTIGAVTNVNNLTMCNGNPNAFILNDTLNVTAHAGQQFTINLMAGGDVEGLGVWIDFNNDGVYSANEFVFSAPPSINVLQTGIITVPLNAQVGPTRMRVRAIYNNTPLATDACTGITWGETEDYTFTILAAPPITQYVWNQTTPAAFATPANWTPTRNFINMNDILVFNSGTTVTASGVTTQQINGLYALNGTTTNLTATDIATITVRDTLRFAGNSFINLSTGGNNVRVRLGFDTLNIGILDTLTGGGRIQGRFGRFITTVGPATYYYPLADSADMRAITLNYTTAPTTGGVLSGEFIIGAPGGAGLPVADPPLSIANVATAGIWQATNEGIVGGTFNLSALVQNVTGVNNVAGTSLIFRTDALANWGTAGTYAPSSGTATALVLNRTGIPTTSGQIGIGGDASNPLPVTLLSFEGRSLGSDVVLNWITTSEFNNSGFVVERSVDGRNFERVTFVAGQINSRTRVAYQSIDEMAFRTAASNVLYYRLRQVDVDGSFTYSNVVRVSQNDRNGAEINVQPNPFTGITNVVIASPEANDYTIRITDVQGKLIAQRALQVEKGLNTVSLTELDNVVPGVYFIQVQGTESKLIKVVKSGN